MATEKGSTTVLSSHDEQRLVTNKDSKLNINDKEGRSAQFMIEGLAPALQLSGEELQTMEDGTKVGSEVPKLRQYSNTATINSRLEPRVKEMKPAQTTKKGQIFQTQAGSVAPQAGKDRTAETPQPRPKQPLPNFAGLSQEVRKKVVAEMASQQIAAQAALDLKYERFRRTYTQPWELFRETRQKAAEEMVRAAKAEDIQRSTNHTDFQEPRSGKSCTPGRSSQFAQASELENGVAPSIAVHKPEKTIKAPEVVDPNRNANFVADCSTKIERKHFLPAPGGKLQIGKGYVPPSTKQSLPRSGTPAMESEAEEIARLVERIGLKRTRAARKAPKSTAKAKVPRTKDPKDESNPAKDPPKRRWKPSDPAIDPDSLIARYDQLESVEVPELDRDESRRIFKTKQEQLKKQRERNWWEQDENAVPEDDWQRFARERHPGAEAAQGELHQHYRMLNETVPPRNSKSLLNNYADIKYNKKRKPAMPVLEEGSKAEASIHGIAREHYAPPAAGSSLEKKKITRSRAATDAKSCKLEEDRCLMKQSRKKHRRVPRKAASVRNDRTS